MFKNVCKSVGNGLENNTLLSDVLQRDHYFLEIIYMYLFCQWAFMKCGVE